jgi:hypothetical protein
LFFFDAAKSVFAVIRAPFSPNPAGLSDQGRSAFSQLRSPHAVAAGFGRGG